MKRLLPSSLAATLTAVGLAAVTTPAAAATPATSPQRCVTVLERPSPTSPETRVASYTCGTGAAAAAPVTSATYTPLIILYEAIRYGGKSNVIYGKSGPCDATGYTIHDTELGDWGDKVSSFKWASNCVMVDGFHDMGQTGFCIHWYGNVDWVGSRLNDHIYSFHVSASSDYCNR